MLNRNAEIHKAVYHYIKAAYARIIPEKIRKIVRVARYFIKSSVIGGCKRGCAYLYEMVVCAFEKSILRVAFVNFWQPAPSDWFLAPLISCSNDKMYRVVKYSKADLQFFSVFGSIDTMINSEVTHKIFFTGENTRATSKSDDYKQYQDNCVNHVSLSLGFDYMDNDNYMRFPLWLLYFFSPLDTKDTIQKKLNEFSISYKKNKFCALISRHDDVSDIRLKIFSRISEIGHVDCPSSLFYNDDTLRWEFNDDKRLYLRQYYFNICPENSVSAGYVTEKLFEALYSGCVPIYFGGGGTDTEPGIINPGCFLWFDPDADNKPLLDEIKKLYTNSTYFENFKRRQIFLDTAVDKIYYMLQQYTSKIREIASASQSLKIYRRQNELKRQKKETGKMRKSSI
jgi:hypothetical protein